MNKINYTNNTDYKIDTKNLSSSIDKYLDDIFHLNDVMVEVHFISSSDMQKLNKKYRNIDKNTDVLSFPIYKDIHQIKMLNLKKIHLGDIFISPKFAESQARQNHKSFNEEIIFLAKHSIKHLLGIHHK